jgi:hypothetical protein
MIKVLKEAFYSFMPLSLGTFIFWLSKNEEGKHFLSGKKIQTADIFK